MTIENDQLQQSADRFRDAVEQAEQKLNRIQTPKQRAANRLKYWNELRGAFSRLENEMDTVFPWRRFTNNFIVWHWFPDGRRKKAACGHLQLIGLSPLSNAISAEYPNDRAEVCPDCLAKWDARQAKTS